MVVVVVVVVVGGGGVLEYCAIEIILGVMKHYQIPN